MSTTNHWFINIKITYVRFARCTYVNITGRTYRYITHDMH
ncbi:hypothetical protein GBAR_LOCUS20793, partial [Geodia barretti]